MKIVLIGPVYPYKGGISHYTGLLYKALVKKGFEVSLHSFKFQYPKFLYKKEQQDRRNLQFQIQDANYSIHTANPLNWVLVSGRIKKEKPDLIVVQWWHPYFAPCYFSICKLLKKQKVLFICHNIFPHERFPMDKVLTKMVLKQGNCFITQSNMDANDLLSIKSDAVYCVTPHPTYNAFKIQNLSLLEARSILKIDEQKKVLLFFGFVREYKGLKYLLEAMPQIKKSIQNTELWVVGDFGDNKQEYFDQITHLSIEDNVKIVEGYIADGEVEKYFAACDLVVLPYTSATQSGIAQIAFGFEKPVLATNVGGLPDVVANLQTGYIVEPESAEQIANAVEDFFGKNRAGEFQSNIQKEAGRFSWDVLVGKICELGMKS